jgi:transposase
VSSLEDRLARLESRVEVLEAENAQLRRENAELRAQLGQTSRNSGKPPSSDPPAVRDERPQRPSSGRAPGGQPGHKPRTRTLVPPEKVNNSTERYPRCCRGCKSALPNVSEGEPLVHQVVEIPAIVADVSQWILHAVRCPKCRTVTRARLPKGVPIGMLGPNLMALIALFIAGYKISRRNVQQILCDVLGVKLSLGTISNAEEKVSSVLEDAHDEAARAVDRARAKNADATTWRHRGAGRTLWVIASKLATVFHIVGDGTRETFKSLLGSLGGVLMTDRATQFGFWAMEKRQVCWAHLIRKFVAFSEHSDASVSQLGETLVLLSQAMLSRWHRARDVPLARERFARVDARNAEALIVAQLERGVALRRRGVSGACRDILKHRAALFTFANAPGVEPTNNHAERELRGFVLWRKTSLGSQSERGDRFAERMMTVLATLRKHGRHPLAYLREAVAAGLRNAPTPALIPVTP